MVDGVVKDDRVSRLPLPERVSVFAITADPQYLYAVMGAERDKRA